MQPSNSHSPSSGSQQPLLTFGILAMLAMAIVGGTLDGAGAVAGTIALAAVSVIFFVLAVRAVKRGSK